MCCLNMPGAESGFDTAIKARLMVLFWFLYQMRGELIEDPADRSLRRPTALSGKTGLSVPILNRSLNK